MEKARPSRLRRGLAAGAAACAALWLAGVAPLHAEEPDAAAPAAPAGGEEAAARPAKAAAIRGQVFDKDTGKPVEGVKVVVVFAATGSGKPHEESMVTGADGAFLFKGIPAGWYDVRFSRPGYEDSVMPNVEVALDRLNRADFPLPRLHPAEPEAAAAPLPGGDAAPPGIEEFVVVGSVISMDSLALRVQSDKLLNVLSAEELSKFAAGDVADALNRVSGVSVVKGQFAVIRGLEDRYSSTLYNGAPIPSPDPDRQSVQLDLFPSDIVSNLQVSKTFAPDLPSNSSGGDIDIISHDYPQDLEFKIGGGTGFNSNAQDRFIKLVEGSPVGKEGDAPLDSQFGASVGGRQDFLGHEVRFKGVWDQEVSYGTAEGFQEGRQPAAAVTRLFPKPARVVQSGDLSLGQLSLSDGRFDLTQSTKEDRRVAYAGIGVDLDEGGRHRLDGSFFWVKKKEEVVLLKENGVLPNFDYSTLIGKSGIGFSDFAGFAAPTSPIARGVRDDPLSGVNRGAMWFTSFAQSNSYETSRDLYVYQLNGDHQFEQVPGLHFSWAGNHAKTTQEEVALGSRFFYEPDDPTVIPATLPGTPETLGPGSWVASKGIFSNTNDIHEDQNFGRGDLDYERELTDWLVGKIGVGGWYEKAKRDVTSSFLESPSVSGSSQFAILGDSMLDVGKTLFETLDQQDGRPSGIRDTTNDSSRDIWATYVSGKVTLFDQVDLLGGLRYERIKIESNNNPFTGEFNPDGSPKIYPTAYLYFDRPDNPGRPFELPTLLPPPPGTTFNDQLLGITVPIDPTTGFVDLTSQQAIESLVNGKIDETRWLPSAGFAYRPVDGLALRGAWSKTVARPSFREMGYYVSVEPATDDLIVGNPQLQLSDVKSYDLRAEYTYGERGDLVAVSGFYKRIDNPIESTVLRNPLNLDPGSSAIFRTFFNNPNTATVKGIETEVRKNFGFLGPEFLDYFSVGGNFTWIDAKVKRTEFEIQRDAGFFGTAAGQNGDYSSLKSTRRLFGQPKYIGNVDLTFDYPAWGTKVTLAWFAISDVLDAAGTAFLAPDGTVFGATLDRYIDAFNKLDLVVSQTYRFELTLPGEVVLPSALTFKFGAKNLTDSSRKLVYDKEQTGNDIAERSFKVGRDYSFSLNYTITF